jgi:putative ABC transport system substrate-binding protein
VTTPVVFAFVSDPVGLGIVKSPARPGGNFTGISYSDAVLGGKRLELLMDMLPSLQRVAVIWSRDFAGNSAIFGAIRAAAPARRVELFPRLLRGADDLASAFDDAKASGAQAAIFMTDNVLFGRRPDLGESYRRAAALADAILKGARPADLPVEEPTRFTLAVNLKTAAALAISVPPAILMRADKVVE